MFCFHLQKIENIFCVPISLQKHDLENEKYGKNMSRSEFSTSFLGSLNLSRLYISLETQCECFLVLETCERSIKERKLSCTINLTSTCEKIQFMASLTRRFVLAKRIHLSSLPSIAEGFPTARSRDNLYNKCDKYFANGALSAMLNEFAVRF